MSVTDTTDDDRTEYETTCTVTRMARESELQDALENSPYPDFGTWEVTGGDKAEVVRITYERTSRAIAFNFYRDRWEVGTRYKGDSGEAYKRVETFGTAAEAVEWAYSNPWFEMDKDWKQSEADKKAERFNVCEPATDGMTADDIAGAMAGMYYHLSPKGKCEAINGLVFHQTTMRGEVLDGYGGIEYTYETDETRETLEYGLGLVEDLTGAEVADVTGDTDGTVTVKVSI